MTKIEERALELYPYVEVKDDASAELADFRSQLRTGFVSGYRQAMKDVMDRVKNYYVETEDALNMRNDLIRFIS